MVVLVVVVGLWPLRSWEGGWGVSSGSGVVFLGVLTFRSLYIIFQLRTTKRVYNLMCESRREAEVWVEKLQNMNV